MPKAQELDASVLYRVCDAQQFRFETTADLAVEETVIGQPRAAAAATFGVEIDRKGYNLFVLGEPGTGRHRLVRRYIEERARKRPAPSDWCYVYNFGEPMRPKMLRLSAGNGIRFRNEMEQLVGELRTALTAALESEEYQTQRQILEHEFEERQSAAFEEVQRDAETRGIRMIQSPGGILFAPLRGGDLIPPGEVQKLPEAERARLEQEAERLQGEIQKRLRQLPRWQRERREKIRELNRQVTSFAVGSLIEERRNEYREEPEVRTYLDAVERDLVENAPTLIQQTAAPEGHPLQALLQAGGGEDRFLHRYRVNLIVDHAGDAGAPVVEEDHPTFANLLGRLEHRAQFGTMVTDFDLLRGGALHRANGGYLLLDAFELLRQPLAWEGLKRALRTSHLKITSLGESLGLVPTVSLEPDPIPLDVKVVLIGEPWLYYLLCERDPEFGQLFKVSVELDDRVERSPDWEGRYAGLVASLVREEGLRAFDRGAVARTIERATRLAADSERLTLNVRELRDLVQEADHWAECSGCEVISAQHVDQAVEQQIYRADRIRERIQEALVRGTLDVSTEGLVVGQINGLSVLTLGGFSFGRPSRITARVRLGSGEVVDIEREVKLAGPLHSKGVLILSGFLGERYASETPLSLAASLVFEQSYSGVEGDSASLAELYALLSSIARVPLRQDLAVTGSVNQHGRVQAIGGVNEKIEGFFDLCRVRGLSGQQGVLIPETNRVHLMLRSDVVDAVREGRFHVYTVSTVDDGIEVLTGMPPGGVAADGSFPTASFNEAVRTRLQAFAASRKAFSEKAAQDRQT